MKQVQVCIVGGGSVGLTLALGLSKSRYSVVVLDAAPKQTPPTDEYGMRVSALSIASQLLLGPTKRMATHGYLRASAYTHMDVRDARQLWQNSF